MADCPAGVVGAGVLVGALGVEGVDGVPGVVFEGVVESEGVDGVPGVVFEGVVESEGVEGVTGVVFEGVVVESGVVGEAGAIGTLPGDEGVVASGVVGVVVGVESRVEGVDGAIGLEDGVVGVDRGVVESAGTGFTVSGVVGLVGVTESVGFVCIVGIEGVCVKLDGVVIVGDIRGDAGTIGVDPELVGELRFVVVSGLVIGESTGVVGVLIEGETDSVGLALSGALID